MLSRQLRCHDEVAVGVGSGVPEMAGIPGTGGIGGTGGTDTSGRGWVVLGGGVLSGVPIGVADGDGEGEPEGVGFGVPTIPGGRPDDPDALGDGLTPGIPGWTASPTPPGATPPGAPP
jgi:hypothetical protein